MRRVHPALIAVVMTIFAWPATAAGSPGDLDTSFNGTGKQTMDFGGFDRATHLAIAPDGKIVAVGQSDATGAGDYAVARLTAAGAPDDSFGDRGTVTVGSQPGVEDIGGGVVVLPDGRIVVTGRGNSTKDFVTKRLNSDGGVDGTFGSGGTSVVDFGGDDSANDMIRQPDGKLVIVGTTVAGGSGDFAIARLNEDGSPDTTFSGDGMQTVDFGGDDSAQGVALTQDGKIVVVGGGSTGNDMAVTRLNSDGSLDTSFSPDTGDKELVSFGGNDAANAVAIQPDGKLVLVGTEAVPGNTSSWIAARLGANGGLDRSFRGDGRYEFGLFADFSGLGVAIQQDGKIVMLGTGGFNKDFLVTRLNSDGSEDSGFNGTGSANLDFGATEFDGDVALQPDGKVVTAGSTNLNTDWDMAFARLQGGSPVGPSGVSLQPPSGPLVAGLPSTFQAAPNAGSTVDHYDWDLNGDGKPDVTCGADTPQLQVSFPGPYSGPISVTAVGVDQARAQASVNVGVAPAPTVLRNQIIDILGVKIKPYLLPKGVVGKYVSATCVRPPDLPKIDSTPNGGPPTGCSDRLAVAGILTATGCFTRPAPDKIPRREQTALATLDAKFAQSLAAGHGGSSSSAHASLSFAQFGVLLMQLARGVHMTSQPARVNGLDIAPIGNAVLVFEDGNGSFTKDEAYIVSSKASISIRGVEMYRGPVALKVGLGHPTVHVTDFNTSSAKVLAPALEVNRGTSTVDFAGGGVTNLGVHVLLPDVFGGVTGDAIITLSNPNGAQLSTVEIHASGFAIAGIGINQADLVYHGSPLLLTSDFDLALSDEGPELKAHLELGENNGDHRLHFHSLDGSYSGPPFINLAPGVDLTEIEGNFSLFPPKTVLGAGGTVDVGGPPDVRIDCPPYRIHGHVDLTFYPPPYALDGTGDASMFCQPIVHEFLHVDTRGYVHFGGHAQFDLGPLSLKGDIDAQFFSPHFTATGDMNGCLGDYACAGGNGIISDVGAALCYSAHIGWKHLGVTIHVGGGFDWPPPATLVNPVSTTAAIISSVRIFIGDCDFSHYTTIRSAAHDSASVPGERDLTVPRGQQAAMLAVKGAGGVPPDVEIDGPDSSRPPIVLPASGPLQGREDAIGFRSPQDGTSYVVVAFPEAGRWRIVPRPGSSAITGVQTAVALPPPSIHLTRRPSRHGQINYSYDIKPIPGQSVTFVEEVGGAARQLQVAHKNRGTLSFLPSTAAGTSRSIVAVVNEDGRPRTDVTVAHFKAKPTRPARPGRLRVQRHGMTLKVTWSPSAHAGSYIARVKLSDGRSLMFFVKAKARTFSVPGVAASTKATVRVSGVIGRSVQGPAAIKKVGAQRRRR
jgi:uncharacterized delta-60 repeat protein